MPKIERRFWEGINGVREVERLMEQIDLERDETAMVFDVPGVDLSKISIAVLEHVGAHKKKVRLRGTEIDHGLANVVVAHVLKSIAGENHIVVPRQ